MMEIYEACEEAYSEYRDRLREEFDMSYTPNELRILYTNQTLITDYYDFVEIMFNDYCNNRD